MSDILQLFAFSVLISLATFGGGSQALFYQYGVEQTHWIDKVDLSAILAFGYATPGPAVFGTATFIGYKIAGLPGALVGTVGIFIVPFVMSICAAKYFTHLLKNQHAALFVKGVGLSVAGLVAVTAFSVIDVGAIAWWQVFVGLCALLASLRWSVNPLSILIVGGLLGIIV